MDKELKELLDSLIYYKSDDGEEYTPRVSFEKIYKQLTEDSDGYFAELLEEVDAEAAEEELKIFNSAGGEHDGAMVLLRSIINLLEFGTLEYKKETE